MAAVTRVQNYKRRALYEPAWPVGGHVVNCTAYAVRVACCPGHGASRCTPGTLDAPRDVATARVDCIL